MGIEERECVRKTCHTCCVGWVGLPRSRCWNCGKSGEHVGYVFSSAPQQPIRPFLSPYISWRKTLEDVVGNRVGVGDTIAYSHRDSTRDRIHKGIVEEITDAGIVVLPLDSHDAPRRIESRISSRICLVKSYE